jgi:hypothetical protein
VTAAGNLFSTPIRELGVAPIAHGAILKNAVDLGNNYIYWLTAATNVSGRQFSIGNSAALTTQQISTWVNLWPPAALGPRAAVTNVLFNRTSRHYFSHRLTTGLTGRFTLNNSQVNQASAANNWNTSNPRFVRFGAYNTALNLTASFVFLSNSLVTDAQDSAMYLLLQTNNRERIRPTMSTTRTYQFDVDTKRYLNRVNTYRSLNGLPNIQKSDAADIDNFVIGLKDLGVWQNIIEFWLLKPEHSLGTRSLVLGGIRKT